MYILGFAIGPMLLAPLSEYFGRNPVYIGSWFILVIFNIPIALAPNVATVIVCRLIQGFGGSAPLTNTGGTVSDLWQRNKSGNAMAIYGMSSTFGPPMALVISGYIAQNKGWRFLFWFFMAVTGAAWIIMILTLPETRHSILLERKAKKVRKILRKEGLASAELIREANHDEAKSLHSLFFVTLTRPFRFLFTEPITMGAAAYNGFIYGLVYLFNDAFPLVFGDGHGFNTGEWGLSFLGIALGSVAGAILHPLLQERHYLRKVRENDGKGVPEARLWMALAGSIIIPISLFWFAWTSFSSVPWIVPIVASSFFGLGIYIVILSILNYVVDSYQTYSASALAGTWRSAFCVLFERQLLIALTGVILIRNIVGAGYVAAREERVRVMLTAIVRFPLFGTQMYDYLGYEWASTLLAFLAILMVPIIFLWYFYGERLRLKSPFAREHFDQDEDAPH